MIPPPRLSPLLPPPLALLVGVLRPPPPPRDDDDCSSRRCPSPCRAGRVQTKTAWHGAARKRERAREREGGGEMREERRERREKERREEHTQINHNDATPPTSTPMIDQCASHSTPHCHFPRTSFASSLIRLFPPSSSSPSVVFPSARFSSHPPPPFAPFFASRFPVNNKPSISPRIASSRLQLRATRSPSSGMISTGAGMGGRRRRMEMRMMKWVRMEGGS